MGNIEACMTISLFLSPPPSLSLSLSNDIYFHKKIKGFLILQLKKRFLTHKTVDKENES